MEGHDKRRDIVKVLNSLCDRLTTSSSHVIDQLAYHFSCCGDLEKTVQCYDYMLNEYYPSHPNELRKFSGKAGPDVLICCLYQRRGNVYRCMKKYSKAKKDFETALKKCEQLLSSNSTLNLPRVNYVRLTERIRLDLALTCEKMGKRRKATKLYWMIYQNLIKNRISGFKCCHQNRFIAALHRTGLNDKIPHSFRNWPY